MKGKSSDSIMKLNQFADNFWCLKKIKICITKQEQETIIRPINNRHINFSTYQKTYQFESIGKLKKYIYIFFIGTNVYKKQKI